jgi:hypothetical protein
MPRTFDGITAKHAGIQHLHLAVHGKLKPAFNHKRQLLVHVRYDRVHGAACRHFNKVDTVLLAVWISLEKKPGAISLGNVLISAKDGGIHIDDVCTWLVRLNYKSSLRRELSRLYRLCFSLLQRYHCYFRPDA